MDLPRNGREYCTWPTTGAPEAAAFEASFDGGETWVAMESVADGARLLIAGPDVDQGSAAVQLPAGRTLPKIRLTDNPEVVVRGGGVIDVK